MTKGLSDHLHNSLPIILIVTVHYLTHSYPPPKLNTEKHNVGAAFQCKVTLTLAYL